MFRNYLNIAWRNLQRNKFYSAINIGGLAIGMSVAMLIGLWLHDEMSFNKTHENYEAFAKVLRSEVWEGNRGVAEVHPIPMAAEIRSSYGQYFSKVVMASTPQTPILTFESKKIAASGKFMESGAAELLGLDMIEGSRDGLSEMHVIFLSATLAKKLFGDSSPLNKTLKYNDTYLNVSGVYENFPLNDEFKALEFIAPWDLYVSMFPVIKNGLNEWNDMSFPIYVELAPYVDLEEVSSLITYVGKSNYNEQHQAYEPEIFLHPMSKWHLYSHFDEKAQIATSEPMKFVRFYAAIGIFVLFLACINFMNLSTARSEKRSKEVGIRKTIGSVRSQLITQFLSESLLLAALAFCISICIVDFALPWFNQVSGKAISILWTSPYFWLSGLMFTIVTALLAGSYPAFYLSSFKPIQVLKGVFKVDHSAAIFRKGFVVFQFCISIALILGTIVIYKQIQFAKDRSLGYEKNGLIRINTQNTLNGKEDIFRTELLKTGLVNEMAAAGSKITDVSQSNPFFSWEGKDPNKYQDFGFIAVSPEYGKTVGWELISGRDFSRGRATDDAGLIINESVAKIIGFEDPIGKTITWSPSFMEPKDFTILGVVKDMVTRSPFEPTVPTVFLNQGFTPWAIVKFNASANIRDGLAATEKAFTKVFPTLPFEYVFVDDAIALKFAAEERLGKMAGLFSLLAIFISCLGLFGMAAYTAEQRTKEIGIRKILGASVANLWAMLSKDFVVLVVISMLIASPIAWYFIKEWLQNYTYHTALHWWIFAGTGLGVIAITLIIVSFQIIKVAVIYPVNSLKNE
ncbi:MAG: FtsX-like permease family protein [Saprospiraceae bacterium]